MESKALLSGRIAETDMTGPAAQIINAIRLVPEVNFPIHRGLTGLTARNLLEKWEVGDVVDVPRLSSFSTRKSMAIGFSNDPGAVITVVGPKKALSVKTGAVPGELEWVSFGKFKVIKKEIGEFDASYPHQKFTPYKPGELELKNQQRIRDWSDPEAKAGTVRIVLQQVEVH